MKIAPTDWGGGYLAGTPIRLPALFMDSLLMSRPPAARTTKRAYIAPSGAVAAMSPWIAMAGDFIASQACAIHCSSTASSALPAVTPAR